jgi:hypothetical protein
MKHHIATISAHLNHKISHSNAAAMYKSKMKESETIQASFLGYKKAKTKHRKYEIKQRQKQLLLLLLRLRSKLLLMKLLLLLSFVALGISSFIIWSCACLAYGQLFQPGAEGQLRLPSPAEPALPNIAAIDHTENSSNHNPLIDSICNNDRVVC